MTVHDGICVKWCYGDFTSLPAKVVFLFNISKVLEFMDTVFIILRKRELIFLHYYHHLVTFLFCWYMNLFAAQYNCGPYLFALMNYGVHTFMYFYYFLRSLNIRPPFDVLITIAQIIQMVGGMVILYVMAQCPSYDYYGIVFGWSIYFSFFLLFCQVFFKRYVSSDSKKANIPPKKNAGEMAGKKNAGMNNTRPGKVSQEKKKN
jgi:hypothetical protein